MMIQDNASAADLLISLCDSSRMGRIYEYALRNWVNACSRTIKLEPSQYKWEKVVVEEQPPKHRSCQISRSLLLDLQHRLIETKILADNFAYQNEKARQLMLERLQEEEANYSPAMLNRKRKIEAITVIRPVPIKRQSLYLFNDISANNFLQF